MRESTRNLINNAAYHSDNGDIIEILDASFDVEGDLIKVRYISAISISLCDIFDLDVENIDDGSGMHIKLNKEFIPNGKIISSEYANDTLTIYQDGIPEQYQIADKEDFDWYLENWDIDNRGQTKCLDNNKAFTYFMEVFVRWFNEYYG